MDKALIRKRVAVDKKTIIKHQIGQQYPNSAANHLQDHTYLANELRVNNK